MKSSPRQNWNNEELPPYPLQRQAEKIEVYELALPPKKSTKFFVNVGKICVATGLVAGLFLLETILSADRQRLDPQRQGRAGGSSGFFYRGPRVSAHRQGNPNKASRSRLRFSLGHRNDWGHNHLVHRCPCDNDAALRDFTVARSTHCGGKNADRVARGNAF